MKKSNKTTMNNIIKYFIVFPISTLIIFKYIFCNDKRNQFIGIILMLILFPLLFIHSQSNIFEYFSKNKKNQNESAITNCKNKDYSRFNNKLIVITGCSSGLGEGIVDILLNNKNTSTTIIVLNRKSKNQERFFQKINKLKNINKPKNISKITSVEHIECDLTDFNSVTKAYKSIIAKYPKGIDVLINNAGVSNTLNEITTDGYNNQIQTNFISHALLIELFLKNHNMGENKEKKNRNY